MRFGFKLIEGYINIGESKKEDKFGYCTREQNAMNVQLTPLQI